MVHAHRAAVLQVDGIVFRKAEIRIVQVFLQLQGGLHTLRPVQDEQALEAAGQQQVRVQRFLQAVLLPPEHNKRDSPAVEAGPADRVRHLPPDGMPGLQAAQGFQVLLRQRRGEAVPGTGHILRRRVDDPHGQPGFPVHGGQQFRIR